MSLKIKNKTIKNIFFVQSNQRLIFMFCFQQQKATPTKKIYILCKQAIKLDKKNKIASTTKMNNFLIIYLLKLKAN